MIELKRMWVNQPSTLQPYHSLHGTNVLAYKEYDNTYCIYFLSGPVVSQQIAGNALSPGWHEKPTPDYQAVLQTYRRLEEENAHSENALLLAQTFGTQAEISRARKLLAEHKRVGFATEVHTRFQFEMSQKYYRMLCKAQDQCTCSTEGQCAVHDGLG